LLRSFASIYSLGSIVFDKRLTRRLEATGAADPATSPFNDRPSSRMIRTP
jgi:hypothetical protein